MSLLRSSLVVGGLTGASRVLGFAREVLFAQVFGADRVSDAFFVAFRLPNLFRRVLAEGAFNSAFVPLYARRLEGGDPDGPTGEAPAEAARRFASETLSALLVALLILVGLIQLAMPFVILGLAPGYAGDAEWLAETTALGLVMMPYIAFMSLMAMLGGVLNAHGRFAAFAFAPTLLNIVLVGLLLAPIGEDWAAARVVAWGVFAAGLLQLALVWAGVLRAGIRLSWPVPRLTRGVRRVIALGAPGALAAGVTQINIVISQMIASTVPGAVSWLAYADRLYQLPLGMIGIAMGVALLPTLSRRLRAEDLDGARQSLNRAIEIALFFTLPASAALAVAAPFWIGAIFERGAFDAGDTAATWPLLLAFAIGLPAFIAIKVLSPAFFGREDTKTPMRYAIVSVVVNIAAGVALFIPFGVVGLAAGTTIAAWVNTALLARTLARDGLLAPDAGLRRTAPRLLAATGVMAVALAFLAPVLTPRLAGGLWGDLVGLAALALAGLAVYGAAAVGLRAVRPRDLGRALRRA